MEAPRSLLRLREPLNKSRAGATEALWDAVLGGSPKQYREYCEGFRQRNAPPHAALALRGVGRPARGDTATASGCASPRPVRVRTKTRVCVVALLADILDISFVPLLASITFWS